MRNLLVLMSMLYAMPAIANPACAVCTVAIGAGLDVANRLGVPDSIVGLWAGALLALLGYWTLKFMDARKWHFWGRDIIVMLACVATIGFVYMGIVDYNPVSVCGVFVMDPLLFGTMCGAIIFILTSKLYQWLKKKNGGHAHFPFEKVVLPVVVLMLVSWLFSVCF